MGYELALFIDQRVARALQKDVTYSRVLVQRSREK